MLRRITLLAAGAALVAVVMFAVPLGIFIGRGYVNDERLELERSAASAAAAVRGDFNLATAQEITPSEMLISLYDAQGGRRAGTGPTTADRTIRAALQGHESSSTGSGRIVVAAPVSDGDQVTGAVVLSTGLGPVRHRAFLAWLALAGIGLVAVALAALLARVMARRLAAPIEQLTDAARQIGGGDLTARAAPSTVPELNILAQTLNTSAEQLDSMLARERRFSAEVSHQLRTPLTGLRLELETARDDPAARSTSLGSALDALDRLDGTIGDVIALARDLPTARVVGLSTLLTEAEQRWHGVLAAASRPLQIATERDLPSTLPIAKAAAAQILDVLLSNAVSHGRGAVTITVRPADGATAIDVADEGPAVTIEPHQLFRRRDKSSGHGIGLPFARRLAETEGARLVLLHAAPPTFTLMIPEI